MTAIILLAAGASRRMLGRDKLMEEVDGMPLLRRQALRACAASAPVFVTLPPAPHPRYGALEGLDITVVAVPDASDGMNASLSAGLRAVPSEIQGVMILLADMPDITESDINTIIQGVDYNSDSLIWRATTQDGSAGHPIVFHRQLIPELIALTGDKGGSKIVRAHCNKTVHIRLPAEHARTDLDTPQAWATWRAKNNPI